VLENLRNLFYKRCLIVVTSAGKVMVCPFYKVLYYKFSVIYAYIHHIAEIQGCSK